MRTADDCRSLICLSWFVRSDRKADVKRERSGLLRERKRGNINTLRILCFFAANT